VVVADGSDYLRRVPVQLDGVSQPLSTILSHALVAFTIELDNEFERRFTEAGAGARVA
jgi:hypothetical protein